MEIPVENPSDEMAEILKRVLLGVMLTWGNPHLGETEPTHGLKTTEQGRSVESEG
jgi:hypothetical protein